MPDQLHRRRCFQLEPNSTVVDRDALGRGEPRGVKQSIDGKGAVKGLAELLAFPMLLGPPHRC